MHSSSPKSHIARPYSQVEMRQPPLFLLRVSLRMNKLCVYGNMRAGNWSKHRTHSRILRFYCSIPAVSLARWAHTRCTPNMQECESGRCLTSFKEAINDRETLENHTWLQWLQQMKFPAAGNGERMQPARFLCRACCISGFLQVIFRLLLFCYYISYRLKMFIKPS